MSLMPTRMTAARAWELLAAGNERFAGHSSHHPNMDADRRETLRDGQNPIAVVFSCSDSRVPVELIFDAGLGDIFVVRTAGEILGESVMGSISYAVNSLGVPLVIVLGHEGCGAVAAAADAIGGGTIPDDHQRVLIERVAPSVLRSTKNGQTSAIDFERRHAAETAEQLVQRMPKLRRKVESGEVGIIAAHYRISDGHVDVVANHGGTHRAS